MRYNDCISVLFTIVSCSVFFSIIFSIIFVIIPFFLNSESCNTKRNELNIKEQIYQTGYVWSGKHRFLEGCVLTRSKQE